MKTVTELIVDAYLQGGNDAKDNPLWVIDQSERAMEYAQHQVKLFAMPVVSGAKRKVCPVCWQPLEDGIVKNMCVNDDCPTNGGQTYR